LGIWSKKGSDCRYFCVLQRDKNTLLPIIQRECEADSVIQSDQWAAYRCLNGSGYIHKMVNHQQNFVDPSTGAHTQSIERLWLNTETKIMKTMKVQLKNYFNPISTIIVGRLLAKTIYLYNF
jgi:hypothetical protein